MQKVMKAILFLQINLSLTFCYYSLKLNKINHILFYNSSLGNNETSKNFENKEDLKDYIENLEEYIDLPIDYSELNSLNDSYIITKNLNFKYYSALIKLGSNKQKFRLVLSTLDNFTKVSSKNCSNCNVFNKYSSILSNSSKKLNYSNNFNPDFHSEIFQDSCSFQTESIKNEIKIKSNKTISKFNFEVIESDSSGFLNSDLIDGILSLKYYSNNSEIPNYNFIYELYKNGIISSPSFSIIITSSNINRFYLGDILKNPFIKKNFISSTNLGQCEIIDNDWACKLSTIEYNDLSYRKWQWKSFSDNSTVIFDIKNNFLTIPVKYYTYLILGYTKKRIGKRAYEKIYNKMCYPYNGNLYCSCEDKNDFGIATFHFGFNSKLEIDLRDYVTYNENFPLQFKCKIDVYLTKYNKFIIGAKGLNNTLLSFNMNEKKIVFFHKIKNNNSFKLRTIILILLTFMILIILI